MRTKYYAIVETEILNVITIVVKAENEKEAAKILKNNYKYKKVISLSFNAPIQTRRIHRNSVEKDYINLHSNIYVRKSSRSKLFG